MFEQEALHFIYPTNYGSTHVEELEQCVFLEKKDRIKSSLDYLWLSDP